MSSETTQKRDAILDQAIAVFAELGFQKADVQIIADRAAVGKGTVYRHFGNKDDLFWASLLAVLGRLEQFLLAAMEGCTRPVEKLQAAGEAFGKFFDVHPQYLEVFAQDRAQFRGEAPPALVEFHQRLLGSFAAVLQEGIAAGEVRPVDADQTMLVVAAALYGCVLFPSYKRGHVSLAEMTAQAASLLLQGIVR